MIKGLIIYNLDFCNNTKFTDHIKWFVEEADKLSIFLEPKTNLEAVLLLGDIKKEKPDFIIFFDKDIRLAQTLENIGIKLFNCSSAIEICDDKTLTQIYLEKNNISTPRTIICPKTFFGFEKEDLSFLKKVSGQLKFPLVLKEAFGSFGKEVYLIKSEQELEDKVLELTPKQLLFQEYIQESCGRDIRIYIVGQEFVGAVTRTNDSDFRANATNGGVMKPYLPTKEEIQIALDSCKSIGLDFAGVDILFGKNGPLICEVNSNAHMKNFFEATNINVVRKILEYIKLNITKEIDI